MNNHMDKLVYSDAASEETDARPDADTTDDNQTLVRIHVLYVCNGCRLFFLTLINLLTGDVTFGHFEPRIPVWHPTREGLRCWEAEYPRGYFEDKRAPFKRAIYFFPVFWFFNSECISVHQSDSLGAIMETRADRQRHFAESLEQTRKMLALKDMNYGNVVIRQVEICVIFVRLVRHWNHFVF